MSAPRPNTEPADRFEPEALRHLSLRGLLSPLVGEIGPLSISADAYHWVMGYLEDKLSDWPVVIRLGLSPDLGDARTFFEWYGVLADVLGIDRPQRPPAEILFVSRWRRSRFGTMRRAFVDERGAEHWERLVTSVLGTTAPTIVAGRPGLRMQVESLAGFDVSADESTWQPAAERACEWLKCARDGSQAAPAVAAARSGRKRPRAASSGQGSRASSALRPLVSYGTPDAETGRPFTVFDAVDLIELASSTGEFQDSDFLVWIRALAETLERDEAFSPGLRALADAAETLVIVT